MDGSAELYKSIIDELVAACRAGQGQIGPSRARSGLWNVNATSETMPDQVEINEFLGRLSVGDRETLARILEQAFVSGVHETLVVLNAAGIEPFNNGYEGTPFHDFAGRLGGWQWPEP